MKPFKSFKTIFLEGSCYMVIAAVAPFVELLISDRPLTARLLIAASLIALGSAANALKAFLSQSIQSPDDEKPMQVVAPPGEPLLTQEAQPGYEQQ